MDHVCCLRRPCRTHSTDGAETPGLGEGGGRQGEDPVPPWALRVPRAPFPAPLAGPIAPANLSLPKPPGLQANVISTLSLSRHRARLAMTNVRIPERGPTSPLPCPQPERPGSTDTRSPSRPERCCKRLGTRLRHLIPRSRWVARVWKKCLPSWPCMGLVSTGEANQQRADGNRAPCAAAHGMIDGV